MTDRVGEGLPTCKHWKGIPYRCLECEAEMGEGQAGPSADEPVLIRYGKLRELEAALRASEAALAEAREREKRMATMLETDASILEEALEYKLIELATMTKGRDSRPSWGRVAEMLAASRAEATKAESPCNLCADGNLPVSGPTGYLWHMYDDGEHEPCKARHVCVTRESSTCVWLADGTKVEAKRDPNATGKMWLEVKPQVTIVPAAIRAPQPPEPECNCGGHFAHVLGCPSSPPPPSEEPSK